MTYWREMYKIDILVDCKLLDGTKNLAVVIANVNGYKYETNNNFKLL